MEKHEERKKGEPVLYIHQPEMKKPDNKMQDYFYFSGKEQQIVQPPVDEKGKEVNGPQEQQGNQSKPLSAADYFRYNSNNRTKTPLPFKLATPFRQLSLEDQLNYLASFPENQPPFACEFTVKGKKIIGTLSKRNEKELVVKTFSEGEITILIDELETIRLIG